jgi:hypothetical protein
MKTCLCEITSSQKEFESYKNALADYWQGIQDYFGSMLGKTAPKMQRFINSI